MSDAPQEPERSEQRLNWLQRIFKRIGGARQVDVVAAQIGERAQNVVVGKNIVQIGTLKVPYWMMALVVGGVVVVVGVSIYGMAIGRQTLIAAQATATPLPTPTVTPIPFMTGSFNVAVSKFDVVGEGEGVEMAGLLAQEFTNSLELVLDDLQKTLGYKIEFRTPQAIGFLSGASTEEHANEARALAAAIRANVVIYGTVEVDGSSARLVPEFYVSESANAGLVDTWEITGQYQMGLPIPLPDINNQRERRKVADSLRDRFEALTHMIEGLAAFVSGDYADAQDQFEQALTFDAWNRSEVLYVMAGNAALKQENFDEAVAYYQDALAKNEFYSRAYIGWGSALYGQALTANIDTSYGGVDIALLNRSIETYQLALQPEMDRPPLADVEEKANFDMGQAYFLRALVEQDAGYTEVAQQDLALAIQGFQSVIDSYEAGNADEQKRLGERAARAYARVGLIYRGGKQYEQALSHYEMAWKLLPKLPRTDLERARYEAAMGDIYLRMEQPDQARAWYEHAVEHAPAGSKESKDYEQELSKLGK